MVQRCWECTWSHRRQKIGLVGGAELRAPKARETSRGVRGIPPGKFWNLESLKWHFLRFWGRVYRILNVIKPLPLHIQPLPHLRRRRQGGLSPPFFPLLQCWGALAPPAPPGSAAYAWSLWERANKEAQGSTQSKNSTICKTMSNGTTVSKAKKKQESVANLIPVSWHWSRNR